MIQKDSALGRMTGRLIHLELGDARLPEVGRSTASHSVAF